ncbi:MAG: hypothetical protein ACTSVV_10840 [Promethearchaeota archaeon]
MGLLSSYHSDVDMLGKKRTAFRRLLEAIFDAWITSLKEECKACKIARVIYTLNHRKNPNALDPP